MKQGIWNKLFFENTFRSDAALLQNVPPTSMTDRTWVEKCRGRQMRGAYFALSYIIIVFFMGKGVTGKKTKTESQLVTTDPPTNKCYYCRKQQNFLQCRQLVVRCKGSHVCTTTIEYGQNKVTYSSGCIRHRQLNGKGKRGCETDGKTCWEVSNNTAIAADEIVKGLGRTAKQIIESSASDYKDNALETLNIIYNTTQNELPSILVFNSSGLGDTSTNVSGEQSTPPYNPTSSSNVQDTSTSNASMFDDTSTSVNEAQSTSSYTTNEKLGGILEARRDESEFVSNNNTSVTVVPTEDDTINAGAIAGVVSAFGASAAALIAAAARRRCRKKKRSISQSSLQMSEDAMEGGTQPQRNNWIPPELAGSASPSVPPPLIE